MKALLAEIAALAEKMREKAASFGADDLAARAVCYAVPMQPWRPGLDHVSFWPGALNEFKPGERGDDLRIAAAYLLLEIERLEGEPSSKPAEKRAA